MLIWSSLQSSNYYHKSTVGAKGVRHSTHCVNQRGELFEITLVVNDIEITLQQEFFCYGYQNMTGEPKERGWVILNYASLMSKKSDHLTYSIQVNLTAI